MTGAMTENAHLAMCLVVLCNIKVRCIGLSDSTFGDDITGDYPAAEVSKYDYE